MNRPNYRVKPEMMWKQDEQVEAARKHAGWRDFHRRCGEHNLFFDHIERDGRRGPYKATAFALDRRRDCYVPIHIADGSGKHPIDALVDAYRKANQPVADVELTRLLGTAEPEPQATDLDDILG